MIEFMVPLKTPLIFWADATWHLNDGSVAGHVWHSNLGWGHLKAQIVTPFSELYYWWVNTTKCIRISGRMGLGMSQN